MKTKIFGYVFIALIYAFPFRYAILDPTPSNTINLLCMIATIVGTLFFMGLMMSDNISQEKSKEAKQNSTTKSYENNKAAA
jgi:uncharacterized membrane protein